MVFGIDNKYLLNMLNPNRIYSNYKRKLLLRKFKNKFLILGLNVSIVESKIGKYVYLGNKVTIKKSEISNHSYVNSNTYISNAIIGKFCSIGSNILFGIAIHPTYLISTHPAFYSNNKAFKTYSDRNYFKEYGEKIIIGNDVWIGSNVTIKGGVKIEDGAIIAAGAIVTKDVKPYEVVGGIPAKHIKFRIDEKLINSIRATEWWNKDERWIEENYELFLDNENFLRYFEKNI